MAVYCCSACEFEDHYSAFKAHMTDEGRAAEIEAQDAAYDADEDGPDDLECPECGCTSAVEV